MAKKQNVTPAQQKAAMDKISALLKVASREARQALRGALREAEELAKANGLVFNAEYVDFDTMLEGTWTDGYTDTWTDEKGVKQEHNEPPYFYWSNSSFNC